MAEEKKTVAKKTTTAKKTTSTAKKPTSKTTAAKKTTSTTKKTTATAKKTVATKKTVEKNEAAIRNEHLSPEVQIEEQVVNQQVDTYSLEDREKAEEKINVNKPKKKASFGSILVNGILKQNPVFIGLLGLCSSLALTTSLTNAVGMGLSVVFVLTLSNLVISLLRKLVPDEIRTPVFIVVIASFVTIVELFLKAFIPALYSNLGAFLSLIAVNCIILGRAESFASKNGPIRSIADGLGMGIGYTLTLVVLSLIREVLGSGTITLFDFSIKVLPVSFTISPLTSAMGASIVFSILLAGINRFKFYQADKLAKENEVNK